MLFLMFSALMPTVLTCMLLIFTFFSQSFSLMCSLSYQTFSVVMDTVNSPAFAFKSIKFGSNDLHLIKRMNC